MDTQWPFVLCWLCADDERPTKSAHDGEVVWPPSERRRADEDRGSDESYPLQPPSTMGRPVTSLAAGTAWPQVGWDCAAPGVTPVVQDQRQALCQLTACVPLTNTKLPVIQMLLNTDW